MNSRGGQAVNLGSINFKEEEYHTLAEVDTFEGSENRSRRVTLIEVIDSTE